MSDKINNGSFTSSPVPSRPNGHEERSVDKPSARISNATNPKTK